MGIRTTTPELSSLVAIEIFIEGDTGKKIETILENS